MYLVVQEYGGNKDIVLYCIVLYHPKHHDYLFRIPYFQQHTLSSSLYILQREHIS